MADVSVKMGVSGVSQFRQGLAQAQASVKSIDAALKLNEKQYRATGDAETYMQNKTTQLNSKLQAQQTAVKQAEQALKAMKDSGVDPLSASYQKMETALLNAQSAVLDTQNEINNLGAETSDAAGKTDQLANSLGGLNRKVSLQQVTSAIGSITSGLEAGAKKAAELGRAIWENITDSARWADDTATQAMILNMDVETYQRYKGVFDTIGELTVQEWQKAKLKVQKAINDPTKDQTDVLALLGINTHEMLTGKYGVVEGAARDFEDVFWEIGEKLRAKVASGEMTQDLADTYANAIFGRGFAELNPMFALGKEGFAAALQEQTVASEEAIQKDAELNDKLIQLQNSFTALKAEVTSGLAPALTAAADTINQLLQRVMEYLQTPEGQQALEDMGKAVEGLFSDLSKIDPEQVVSGFAEVFNTIVSGLQWLERNSGTVIGALETIVVGWGALKLTGGALQLLNLVNGLMGLNGSKITLPGTENGGGGSEAAAAAGGQGWLDTIALKATEAATKGVESLGGTFGLFNASFGADYLLHNTEVGRAINPEYGGDISKLLPAIGEWATGLWEGLKTNAGDWWDTASGVYGDTIKFWENFWGGWEEKHSATNSRLFDPDELQREWDALFGGSKEKLVAPMEPEIPDDTAEQLEKQIGTLQIPAQIVVEVQEDEDGIGVSHSFANGLWSVPFDGYAAILHKGERVVPAREVNNSRNFSSNLYVESMYMNNGQDADGLAAAMAAAQRRTMSGYGS